MKLAPSIMVLVGIFVLFSLVQLARAFVRGRWRLGSYLGYLWAFFLAFLAAHFVSFRAGNWVIAIMSFLALREYFSMADIRLQDRLGILGAYASIPFMFHFVTIDWYGMFIISVPVYSFLAIPLLVSLGGKEREGMVFSVGLIDFGLFLFVYCMGHISYLMFYSVWMAAMLILNVALCDLLIGLLHDRLPMDARGWAVCYLVPAPFTLGLTLLVSPWTEIPSGHSAALGGLIPLLVLMGRHTVGYVEADLGVEPESLCPGRGQILDNLKSFLFTAPVVFHYIRYYLR